MSARESGAPEGIKVEQYRALVLTESPQTVLASTGNLIFLTAVKSESVAIVVVAYPPPIFDFPGDNYIQMFYRKKKKVTPVLTLPLQLRSVRSLQRASGDPKCVVHRDCDSPQVGLLVGFSAETYTSGFEVLQ